MVPEGIAHASKRGKQPIFLPSYDANEAQKLSAWYYYLMGAVVAYILGSKQ